MGKAVSFSCIKKVLLTRKGIGQGFIFKRKFRSQLHWYTNSPASVCIHEPLLLSLVKCFHINMTNGFEIYVSETHLYKAGAEIFQG
jgi:hypothetical protein